jgi:alpha-D-ribose 1-methylphosphonate 5-triphosphate diphosphatase PhnM
MRERVANAALKIVSMMDHHHGQEYTYNGREAYIRAESTTHGANEGGGSACVWWPITRKGVMQKAIHATM